MTPAQQTALEALYGKPFTAQQVTDLTPLVTARSDQAVASYLSNGRTVQGSVSTGTLLGWTAMTGLQTIIQDTAHTPGSTYYATTATVGGATVPLRAAALSMLAAQAANLPFDLSASATGQGNLALLGAWVTAGAITAAQEATLVAMAAVPAPISDLDVRVAIGA